MLSTVDAAVNVTAAVFLFLIFLNLLALLFRSRREYLFVRKHHLTGIYQRRGFWSNDMRMWQWLGQLKDRILKGRP